MSTLDLEISVGLTLFALTVMCAFGVRVVALGEVRFARVEAEGSTAFLGRAAMEMTYWVLTPLGRRLARLGISADAITAASLWFGAAAGVMLMLGRFGVAAGLGALSALGDTLDGIVARESRTASEGGEVFDAAVDRYNEFFFLAGLAVWYRDSAWLLALVLLVLLGSFMVSYSSAKAEALQVTPPRGSMRRAERATYLTAGVGLAPLTAEIGRSLPWHVPVDGPVVLTLLLVGIVANASAIRRLSRIRELAAARQRVRFGNVVVPQTADIPPRKSSNTLRSAER